MTNQYYGWLEESTRQINLEDLIISGGILIVVAATFVIGYYALAGFISWVCGNTNPKDS